jgi:hypothetical protein
MLLQKSLDFLEYAKGVRGQSLTKAAKEFGAPIFKFTADSEIQPDKMAALTSSDGAPRVQLVASTTMTDLAADVMTHNAEKRMQEAAVGTTMFMNHKFDVPQDVFGIVEKATLEERELVDTFTNQKTKALCLVYVVRVAQSNPLAIQTYKTIEEGIRLGASVTVLLIDVDRTKDGRQLINDVYYLETSIVGLPMNQYSWVEYALKALKSLELNSVSAQATDPAPATDPASALTQSEAQSVLKASMETTDKFAQVMDKLEERMQATKSTIPNTSDTNGDNKIMITNPAGEGKGQFEAKTKSLMDQSLAEIRYCDNVWDLTWALIDLLHDVIESCEMGQVENPEQMLNDILAEYSARVVACVLPACQAITNANAASTAKSALGLANATRKMLPELAALVMKAGAKHSKDTTESLNVIHNTVAKMLDYKCMKDMDEMGVDGADADDTDKVDAAEEDKSKAFQLAEVLEEVKKAKALFEQDKAAVQKELDAERIEKEQWKALAETTMAKLKAYGREPLPRAGAAR